MSRLRAGATTLGVDLTALGRSMRGVRSFLRDRREFLRQADTAGNEFQIGPLYPCLGDAVAQSGSASGHYFHQDLHVARRIFVNGPTRHVDVGSRIDGFVAHVAAFREIEVLDIRPLHTTAGGIVFLQRDIMQEDPAFDGYCDSVSCLHALEHFGLGRYGDPVRFYGFRDGWRNLCRMLTPGGRLYLSIPIGETQRVEFNAHRVFSLPYVTRELVAGDFSLDSFAFVDDWGDFHTDADPHDADAARTFGLRYGCGIFELIKL